MSEKSYLTVTALTKYIKYKFDQDTHLKNVLLKGEISNFKHHSRGHFYFTLKDDRSTLAAVCWKTMTANLAVQPEEGLEVIATGRLTTFAGQSKYQIVVSQI